MWEYTDKVREHFLNPRNVGVIEDADGIGEVGNPICGDMMKIFIKVEDEIREIGKTWECKENEMSGGRFPAI